MLTDPLDLPEPEKPRPKAFRPDLRSELTEPWKTPVIQSATPVPAVSAEEDIYWAERQAETVTFPSSIVQAMLGIDVTKVTGADFDQQEPTREQRIAAAVLYTHGIVDLHSFGERMTMRRLDEMLQLAARLGAETPA